MSVPIRHPSDKSSAVTSFETDILVYSIYIANATRYPWYIPGISYMRGILMRVAWVVFIEHGGGALGIFKSPVLHLQSSVDLLFVRFTLFFLPKQA